MTEPVQMPVGGAADGVAGAGRPATSGPVADGSIPAGESGTAGLAASPRGRGRLRVARGLDAAAFLLLIVMLALILFEGSYAYLGAAAAAAAAGLAARFLGHDRESARRNLGDREAGGSGEDGRDGGGSGTAGDDRRSAKVRRRALRAWRTPLDWWILAYLLASVVAAAVNWGDTAGRGLGLTLLAVALYAGSTATLGSRWRLNVVLGGLVVGALHVGLLSTHYHGLIGFNHRPSFYPVVSQWSGYPEVGLLMAVALAIVVGFVTARRPWWFVAGGATVAVVLAVHLFATYARGAWVGAVVAVVAVAAWEVVNLRRWRTVVIIVALAAVTAGAVSVVQNPFLAKFLDSSRTLDVNYVARITVWQETWPLVADHWVVGVGPGRFGEAIHGGYADKTRGWALHAHNTELHVWAERGIVGVAALVGMWLHAMWLAARPRRRRAAGVRPEGQKPAGERGSWSDLARVPDPRPALAGALVALFARAQFEHPFDGIGTSPRFMLLFWLLLAMTAAIARLEREETRLD